MENKFIPTSHQREIWIDWMRVAACFMVILVHSTEPFYLGGNGSLILTETDAIDSDGNVTRLAEDVAVTVKVVLTKGNVTPVRGNKSVIPKILNIP